MSASRTAPAAGAAGTLPPGPRGLPLIGNAESFRHDRLGFLTRVQRAYGDAVTVSFGRIGGFFLFSSPEAVERLLVSHATGYTSREINRPSMPFLGDGLLNIDGALHRQQRALVQPAFNRRRVEAYADVMLAYTEQLLARWSDGQVVEMHTEMQRLTLRIVARALLDLELPSDGDAFGQAFSAIASYAEDSPFMIPTLRIDLPFTAWGRFRRGEDFLNAQVRRLIAERRAGGTDAGDVLSTLIAAREGGQAGDPPPDAPRPVPDASQRALDASQPAPDDARPVPGDPRPVPDDARPVPDASQRAPDGPQRAPGDPQRAPGDPQRDDRQPSGGDAASPGTMDDERVRDHVMTLLAAGHETTSNALTFALHLLSRNPDKRGRLAAELGSVLGSRAPGVSDLPHLPYLDAVVKEALRLYPPAWLIGRHAAADDVVLGYRLPAGSMALASQWVIHRLPRYWPQADRFLPERWLPGEGHEVVPYSYFPFGGGPRTCIGMPFAQQEMQLILAALLRRYVPETLPGERLAIRPRITLRPARGTRMRLRRVD